MLPSRTQPTAGACAASIVLAELPNNGCFQQRTARHPAANGSPSSSERFTVPSYHKRWPDFNDFFPPRAPNPAPLQFRIIAPPPRIPRPSTQIRAHLPQRKIGL
jgi:hypothetical protein